MLNLQTYMINLYATYDRIDTDFVQLYLSKINNQLEIESDDVLIVNFQM